MRRLIFGQRKTQEEEEPLEENQRKTGNEQPERPQVEGGWGIQGNTHETPGRDQSCRPNTIYHLNNNVPQMTGRVNPCARFPSA